MLKFKKNHFKAAILDMDGVITKTAVIHSRAWKQMFDVFLKEVKGKDFQPLIIEDDYYRYIDGKPRRDGIRSFLDSRKISIPEGKPGDDPEKNTLYGLGKRKNRIFLEIIKKDGVVAYPDTVEMLKIWKQKNIKLAVISSSRNCKYIIEKAGLTSMFTVRVDGVTLEEKTLAGKPAPDIFLKAAEDLMVETGKTIIIEDALSGIQAGKKGKFSLVVGIARNGIKKEKLLKKAGADIVVRKLTELKELSNEEK